MENILNEFKGFSLFNDIEDFALRTRNRAVTLANIAEANTNAVKRISGKGAMLVLEYFNLIHENEREDVMNAFKVQMEQRGYYAG